MFYFFTMQYYNPEADFETEITGVTSANTFSDAMANVAADYKEENIVSIAMRAVDCGNCLEMPPFPDEGLTEQDVVKGFLDIY